MRYVFQKDLLEKVRVNGDPVSYKSEYMYRFSYMNNYIFFIGQTVFIILL